MDILEKELKGYFAARRLKGIGKRPAADYPDERDFFRFLSDRMSGGELDRMLEHLKKSPEDQKLVATLRGLVARMPEAEKTDVPADLLERVRLSIPAPAGALCPHCHKAITPFKKPLGRQKLLNFLWLAAGAGLLGVSFFDRYHFIQWIAAGALCLMKWIVDSKGTRTQIMIYKALSEGTAAEGRHLHRHESPL